MGGVACAAMRRVVGVLICVPLLAGCGGGEVEPPRVTVPPSMSPTSAPTTTSSTSTSPTSTTPPAPTTTVLVVATPEGVPDVRVVVPRAPVPVTTTARRLPATTSAEPVAELPEPEPEPAASYRNCAEVRAAGAAPIREGDPGFRAKFDRDGDGVGCE